LTTTGYKYLEIGIIVGPLSYVEIAIGDHRKRANTASRNVEGVLRTTRTHLKLSLELREYPISIDSISVGPLTVRFGMMNNAKLIRLDFFDVRLSMTELTLLTMFNLDRCVDIMFDKLNGIVEKVDAKFKRFSNIASSITLRTSQSRYATAITLMEINSSIANY